MKFLVLFIILLCTAVSAWATGNELGNGGDLVAQEFIAAGRKLVQELREKPDSRIPDVDRFAETVEKVRVTSTGSLTLHGAEVDAINYPEEREIDVNRPRWQAADPGKRASLVLHEYLGIMQVNDLHYEISGSYAEPFVPEEKEKKFELAVGTSYGWENPFKIDGGGGDTRSTSPGISAQAGYLVGPQSEITFEFNRQSFGETDKVAGIYDSAWTDTFTEVMVGYKYWLSRSPTWRPFVTFAAGYGRSNYDWSNSFPSSDGYSNFNQYGSNTPTGYFALKLGAGLRYSLLRDVGLDLKIDLHSLGNPVRTTYSEEKLITGTAGVDVVF